MTPIISAPASFTPQFVPGTGFQGQTPLHSALPPKRELTFLPSASALVRQSLTKGKLALFTGLLLLIMGGSVLLSAGLNLDILFLITAILLVFGGSRGGFVFSLINMLSVPIGYVVASLLGPQLPK